ALPISAGTILREQVVRDGVSGGPVEDADPTLHVSDKAVVANGVMHGAGGQDDALPGDVIEAYAGYGTARRVDGADPDLEFPDGAMLHGYSGVTLEEDPDVHAHSVHHAAAEIDCDVVGPHDQPRRRAIDEIASESGVRRDHHAAVDTGSGRARRRGGSHSQDQRDQEYHPGEGALYPADGW